MFMNEPLHTLSKAQQKAQLYAIQKILVILLVLFSRLNHSVLQHATCKKRVMNSLS